jgi:hypothetical protein
MSFFNITTQDANFNTKIVTNPKLKKPAKIYSKIPVLQKKFVKNLKMEESPYFNFKIFSEEITLDMKMRYKSFESFDDFWKTGMNITNFGKNHFHELFSSSLTHCVFTGIFFDVDKKGGSENEYTIMLEKISIFIGAIKKVLLAVNPKDDFYVQIQSATLLKEDKISFHCLVKQNNLVIRNIYHVRVIILEAIHLILQEHGEDFFVDDSETKKLWIDLSVYRENGNFRCLYNSKKAATHRPLIPINTNNTINKDELYNSLFFLPISWLKDSNCLVIVISPKEKDNITRERLKNYTKMKWFLEPLDKMMVGLYNHAKNKDILDYGTLRSITSSIDGITCRDMLADILFENIINLNLLGDVTTEKNIDKKVKIINSVRPYFTKEWPNIGSLAAIEDYRTVTTLTDEQIMKKYQIPTNTLFVFLKQAIFPNYILLYGSANKYCEVKGEEHVNNHVYYGISLTKMTWWQNCYDEECRQKYTNSFKRGKKQATTSLETDGLCSTDPEDLEYGSEFKLPQTKGQVRPLILTTEQATMVDNYLEDKIAIETGCQRRKIIPNIKPANDKNGANVILKKRKIVDDNNTSKKSARIEEDSSKTMENIMNDLFN